MSKLCDPMAEQLVIGASLIDASVPDRVSLDPEHFAGALERRAWAAILALHDEGKPLDAFLISERAMLSPSCLSGWAVHTLTADNAEFYADIVRKHAMTRAVLAATANIHDLHRRGQAEGDELLSAALEVITAIDVDRPRKALTIGQVLRERFRELDEIAEKRARGEPAFTGIPTGIDKLDAHTGGLERGVVTILAGRPGMGKSAFALGVADAASASGHGVHSFSLEDARSAYADRALSRTARVPTARIRSCQLQRSDMTNITAQAANLCRRKHWLYEDVSDLSVDELVRAVRRERVANNTRLVIVDYLQLLRRPRRYETMHDAISQNINALAQAAKHDDIAYLVLSQLSRQVERREDRRPTLADLRESGSLEERAKCVLALYRGSYYGNPKPGIDYTENDPDDPRPDEDEWQARLDILVLKKSHASTGYIRCKWDGPCTRVYE